MPDEIKQIEHIRTHDDNSGLYKKVHQTRIDKNRLP